MNREHHPMGFSQTRRVRDCPASVRLSRENGRSRSTSGSRRGEALHDALRTSDFSGLRSYDREAARKCVKFREEQLEKIGAEKITQTEREVRLTLRAGRHKVWGYADDLTLFDVRGMRGALLCDWKFHPTGVFDELDASWQLSALEAATIQTHPELTGIVAVAYCPFSPAQPLELRVKREVKREWLSSAVRIFTEIYDLASRPDAEPKPGDACKYCPAAGSCQHAVEEAVSQTALVRDVNGVTYRAESDRYEVVDSDLWAGQIERVKAAEKVLKEWLAEQTRAAKDLDAHDMLPEGIVLRRGAPRSHIAGHEGALERLPADVREALERRMKQK